MSNGSGKGKRKHLSLILRTTVAVGALAWVFAGQDWGQLGKVFGRLSLGYFALSLGTFAAAQFLVGLRWWLLLRAQAIHIGFWSVMRLFFLGLFYNNFMPGSVGGDLLRMWYVGKHTDKKLGAALSVFVDRVIGLTGMVVIAVVCYMVFMWGQGVLTKSGTGGGIAESAAKYKTAMVWALGVVLVALTVMMALKRGRALLGRLWSSLCVHGKRLGREVFDSAVIYWKSPLTVIGALGLTILLQSMVIASFWILGINLEIDAGARYFFVFFPLMWVVGAIPVSIAGIGILEGGLVMLFTGFTGAGAEEVLALALCQRIVWILVSLPGGAIHIFGAHLPKDFFVDEKGLSQ